MPRPAPSAEQLPLQQFVVDKRHLLTVPWVGFFQRILDLSKSRYSEGTHEDRLNPDKFPPTTLNAIFYETDRNVYYQVRLVDGRPQWVYISGTMRDELVDIPTDLGENDTGFLFYGTDYAHTWRWTGTTWEFAPGDRFSGEIAWFAVPLGTGWALCDGSATTMTTPEAEVVDVTTPNLIGAYVKGAEVYTGLVVPASGSVAGGTTDPESGHTHAIDHDHPAFESGAASLPVNQFLNGPYNSVSNTHTHTIDVPPYGGTSGPGSEHTHAIGSLPVTAEPQHVER